MNPCDPMDIGKAGVIWIGVELISLHSDWAEGTVELIVSSYGRGTSRIVSATV